MKKIFLLISSLVFVNAFAAKQKPSEKDLGKQALRHTNEFRSQEGLPSLKWNQAMADIAKQHSKNMAVGAVAFGHNGFKDRIRQFPKRSRASAENVFYTNRRGDKAQMAVDAWIHSPGHRENLEGHYSECGVGVYRSNDGRYYFTQLFAQFAKKRK